jgi:hypothetical protein
MNENSFLIAVNNDSIFNDFYFLFVARRVATGRVITSELYKNYCDLAGDVYL